MRILGISAFYHDSAATLLEDGRIVAAAQEERFTRVKHDPSMPVNAMRFCLARAGCAPDAVVFYEKPIVKFERILRTAIDCAPCGFRAFAAAIPEWTQRKLWIPMLIENALRAEGCELQGGIHFTTHHESHAASAFYASPFKEAAILTLDGVGEWTTASFGVGKGNELRLIRELRFPHSLGLLYSAFTHFCGFKVNSGEYKLMGLAPYGKPIYRDLILRDLVELHDDGSLRLGMRYFDFPRGRRMTNRRFEKLFGGPARAPGEPLTQRECDIARSIQEVTEEIVLRMARTLHKLTGMDKLCMAGGVALNCVANARLLREGPFKEIWVQPAAGDAGGAAGCALALHYNYFHNQREADGIHDIMRGAALGPDYSDGEIETALRKEGLPSVSLEPTELNQRIAQMVSGGMVVGLFQGRAEFGPRALGNRSILADARNPAMQETLNLRIKFRESFRPFAPIVLAEHANEYFDLKQSSPYMLFTAPVKGERRTSNDDDAQAPLLERLARKRSDIPAVTHLDYSARVQTVHRDIHPELHALLTEFHHQTGCPVMINTSFNVRGEPPVCSPADAIACFLATGMDALAIGSHLVLKRDVPREKLRQPAFTQDD
jgi:carbamoyltransferase